MTFEEKKRHYEKSKVALRYWLIGRGYKISSKAFEFSLNYCEGLVRKDGDTPAFQHQITVAHIARIYEPFLMHPDETYATFILHDIMEDFGVSRDELRRLFGDIVTDSVWLLTKKYRAEEKEPEVYFGKMSENPIASVGKGCDRISNLESVMEVFSPEKQVEYVLETESFVLPMIKKAQKEFPKQDAVYENIKLMLRSQIHHARMILNARKIECPEAPNT